MAHPAKVRMTSQRRVILDVLKGLRCHPTASEMYGLVKKRLPEISLATVYRNLDILCEHGLAQRLDFAGAQMRFDGDTTTHSHARCLKCGCVADVTLDSPLKLEDPCRERSGFRILGHRLEFLGLCAGCAEASETDSTGVTGKGGGR